MNLERSVISMVPLVLAAALMAFDARAQSPRDCGGSGEAPAVEVARVIDGRSFVLADGREVRLAAIETPLLVPGDEDEARVQAALAARTALETLLLHREVSVTNSGPDRYGRLLGYAFVRMSSGEALVQRELVAAGWALVSATAPAATCRIYLRNAEREARSGGLGLWGDPYHVVKAAADPSDVLAEQGRFVLVQGRVMSVREGGGILYVNFGQRWSEQLTVTILKRSEGIFAGAGLAPKVLPGRYIEVRGWVEERGGPAIEVMRPEQIEVVQ
jgi:endonuclease YncB( thermonuclease family)